VLTLARDETEHWRRKGEGKAAAQRELMLGLAAQHAPTPYKM
jgi:hypothetical protein